MCNAREIIAITRRVTNWIEARAAVIQCVLAIIMLWTLIQMQQSNSTSRTQLLSNIEPVVYFVQFGDNIVIENTGSVDILTVSK
jgi:hypothetical protein